MIENPKIGMECWIVTDVWEEFFAIPVTLIAKNENGIFLRRWHVNEEIGAICEELEPHEMFSTEQAAREKIKLERRLQECRE